MQRRGIDMSWKGILTKSAANETESYQEIEFKEGSRNFSLEIRSEIDGLEYDNIQATIFSKAVMDRAAIYDFQPVRMEIKSITLYIPDEDDSDEKKEISNQKFNFEEEGKVIDVVFEYSGSGPNQENVLVIEPLLVGGDLILEYKDGKITLEQLVLDYSF
jgi:hypothetical protein